MAEANKKTTQTIGFLLMPSYSMLAFTCAVDQLRLANRIAGKPLYDWAVINVGDQTVAASNSLSVNSAYSIQSPPPVDTLFVCGGIDLEPDVDSAVIHWLQSLDKQHIPLGSMCTGTHILAKAGLIQGYRCTIHWENMTALRELYPDLIVSQDIFVIDRDRYTCAGGTSSMDMLVELIARQHGWDLANQIAEGFVVDRIRGRNDRQRYPLRFQFGTSQPKLSEAVELMEANIEEPLDLDDIASNIGITKRQLERLFQKHLHVVPRKYYLNLRLLHARQLVLQTSMSFMDIAIAVGFVSGPHFSKCYREFFSMNPSDDRRHAKVMEDSTENSQD